MIRAAALRLAQLVPLLLVLSWISFGLLEAAPGDAAEAQLANRSITSPTAAQLAAARHNLGLDEPLVMRYLHWLNDALHGDIGHSYTTGEPVRQLLAEALPWTLLLVGCALVLTVLLAVLLGVSVGLARGGWLGTSWRRLVHGGTVVLGACPAFIFALLAVGVLALLLGWLPSGGVSAPGADAAPGQVAEHLVLPALTLACSNHLGIFARLVESGVLGSRDEQHVLTARALGLPRRDIVLQHVLRTSLGPFLARLGTSFGALVGGSYAVEVIFGWPGMGRVTLKAALGHDYATLTGVVLLSGAVVLVVNLLADLAVAWLDPRTRPGSGRAARTGRTGSTAAASAGAEGLAEGVEAAELAESPAGASVAPAPPAVPEGEVGGDVERH